MMETEGYRLIESLYTGRHVSICRALDLSRKCPVIVKAPLSQEAEARRSFEQEIALIKQIGNDFALPFQMIPPESAVMMTTGPIKGNTLRMETSRAPVELEEFFKLAFSLADLIDRLHRSGHIHHSIHPDAVFIEKTSSALRFLDFSYLTTMDQPGDFIMADHQMKSLLPYISPEQTGRLDVSLDYRTDFYSFGVVMYELLTGNLPITAKKPEEWVHGHLAHTITEPRQLRRDISESLNELVMKCLSKRADDRYQSALGLKEDLLRCNEQRQSSVAADSFSLLQTDVPLHFRIPTKQYGREEIMTSVASNLRDGTVILISGDPGIGKTSLLEEIHRQFSYRKGCCLRGKFEQYKQDIPYQPFIEIFRQFITDILRGDSDEMDRWKDILLNALGRNASLIVEFIPQMAYIIGPQPKTGALLPAEAQQRFHLALTKFIEALLKHAKPVTLILDDLQWAGPESLAMLERIAELGEKNKLLLIGAFRLQHQGQTQPMQRSIDLIKSGRLPVREYTLRPLDPEDTCALVSDVLHCSPAECFQLAEHIYRISGGTPQFIKELLSTLHKERCIRFDIKDWKWQWDMASIETFRVSEDIMELLVRNVQKLSPECAEMLGMAACIGTVFDSRLLAGAGQIPVQELTRLLNEAVAAGIVVRHKADLCLFVHDRILQAVRESLSEDSLRRMHYRIGMYLLEQHPDEDHGEHIYDIVNHLNTGLTDLPEGKHRQLAGLNLEAGQRAKSSNAFHSALTFLHSGIGLLAGDAWESDYALTYAFHREWLECEYLCGNYEQTIRLFNSVVGRVRHPLERASMYVILALNHRRHDRSEEAIDAGMKGLEELSIRIPRAPSQLQLITEAARSKFALRKISMERIPDLPPTQDEDVRIAAQLMAIISPCAYLTSPELLAMIGFKLMRLSLRHGNSHHAAEGYIIYAMVTGLHFGNFDAGMHIGQTGLEVSERHGSLASRYTAYFAFGAFFGHWIKPLREIEPYSLRSIDLCMGTGDWTYTSYSIHHYLSSLWYRGETLPKFGQVIAEYEHRARNMKVPMFRLTLRLFGQFLLTLMGETRGPSVWDDDTFSESGFLQEIQNSGMADRKQFDYDLLKLQNYFLMEDYSAAWRHAASAERFRRRFIGVIMLAELSFYGALSALAQFQLMSGGQRKKRWKYIRVKQEELRRWTKTCPDNFLDKQLLVDAEIARVRGRFERAAKLYEQAAKAAEDQGFIQIQAVVYECAARFYISLENWTAAEMYLQKAYRLYDRWGARAKCVFMEGKYASLFSDETKPQRERSNSRGETAAEADRNLSEMMDIAAVINASQAISGEIVVEELLKKLMTVVIQTASAEKGYLFLWRDDKPVMEARGELQNGTAVVEVLQSQRLDELQNLAHSVIHYTAHTKETVVLRHAAAEDRFMTDPYIANQQVKSLLCLPILQKNQLIGMLYLENNLSTGIFTPDRVQMLEMLAAQTAISLQNSRLIFRLQELNTELEDKVKERTDTLLQSMRETAAALTEQSILEERNRLAREIHDTVGHTLTSINIQIEAGKRLLDRDRVLALEKLEQSQKQVRTGLNEIKKALRMLREGNRTEEFSPSLETFIQDTIRQTGVEIRYELAPLPLLTSSQKYVLYRALQEGITNGIRHGDSKEFDFTLKLEEGLLKFQLNDFGHGSRTVRFGLGLTAMKERVEELGGSLRVHTGKGQGCRLSIDIPYKAGYSE